MISVHPEFVRAALQARYDEVVSLWGKDASIALWEQALDMLCDVGELDESPSYYVDNYLVNGDFIHREEQSDDEWYAFAEYSAMLYDDKYACLRFYL